MNGNKKFNKPLTILANYPKISGTMIFGGIIFTTIGNIMILYGSYYRGVNSGVDARDNYYLEKEIKEYEKTRDKADR